MVRYSTPDGVTLSGRATRRRGRFGGVLGGLIVVEVALALALLVGAGLMGRTFNNLVQEDFGFDRDAALTFAVTVPSARWPGADGTVRFYRQLRERLLEIPDVLAVGVGANLPLNGAGAVASVTTERRVEAGETNGITVLQRRAGVGFFEAMGTPIVAGRGFDERDRQDSPTVAVVSASLSRQLFPNEDPVGRRVAFGGTPGADDWMTVVGVVADMRYRDADHIDEPQIYQAHTQSTTREMNVVIRTLGRPLGVIEPARAVLAGLDARIPMDAPQPLHAVVDSALGDREFAMTTFGLFGGVALALTLAGIYGVIAFSAAQRRRELGVRLALGARRADVVRLMVNDGMWLVGGGLILGSAMALGGSNLLVSLLYGVEPIDSSVYGSVVLLLGTAGLAASYLPARLASQLDPLSVLRQD